MSPDVWGKQRLTGLKRRADKDARVARSVYGANEVRSARLDVEIVANRILRQI